MELLSRAEPEITAAVKQDMFEQWLNDPESVDPRPVLGLLKQLFRTILRERNERGFRSDGT